MKYQKIYTILHKVRGYLHKCISLIFLLAELSQANTVYSEKVQQDVNRQKDMARECRWIEDNIPGQLKDICKQLAVFIKGVTRHQRTPATHVLVFMISNEERDKKPYTLPVQCILYKGLSDSMVRQLANKIILK